MYITHRYSKQAESPTLLDVYLNLEQYILNLFWGQKQGCLTLYNNRVLSEKKPEPFLLKQKQKHCNGNQETCAPILAPD